MFNLNLFLGKTISFATLHTSFICAVLIPFFKSHNIGALELATILTAKKITRIVSDIPFGIIFDKFGARAIFIIGRLLKLISFFILLMEPSVKTFIIAMCFDGLSYSAIYGKVNAYIYNTLSYHKILHKYQKAVSTYYFIMDIVLSAVSFVAAVLVKNYSYYILIYCSIALNLFSFVLIFFLDNKVEADRAVTYKTISFSEMIKTLAYLFYNKRILLWLLLFYGFGNFIAWQFGVIGTMVLSDMSYSPSTIAFIGSAAKISMALGCLLPIFWFKNGISMKTAVYTFSILLIMGFISAVIYNDKLFIFFMLSIIYLYTLVEVSVEKTFEKISDPALRGTVIAIGWFFCSIMATVSVMAMGGLAKLFSYHVALVIIMLTCLLFHFVLTYVITCNKSIFE